MNRKQTFFLSLVAAVAGISLWRYAAFIGAKTLAVAAMAVGVIFFLATVVLSVSRKGEASDSRHARQLFVTLGALLVLGGVAREFIVPRDFGRNGYYRAGAVQEARAKQPRHLGKAACRDCHAKHNDLHAKDAHARVQCEDCHGPAYKHAEIAKKLLAANGKDTAKVKLPEEAKLNLPREQSWCLTCHQRLAARPGPFAQIRRDDHYKLVAVGDKQVRCIECHSPHEPLYMDRDLRMARLHPRIHRCRDCHTGKRRKESAKKPPTHPQIFQCDYCHKAIAKRFEDGSHSDVRCTTCHIFFPETDFSGRILRDADPRFCLLCHRQAKFRSDDAPPGIEWPAHRTENSKGPEDATKRCVDCHRENIHPSPTKEASK